MLKLLQFMYLQCALAERPAERAKPVRREEPRQEPGKFDGAGTYAGPHFTSASSCLTLKSSRVIRTLIFNL